MYNTEKRISKKIHDEVSNDVFQLMITLQNNPSKQGDVLDVLDQIYNKTRDIAKEYAVLDYDGNYKEALNDLLLSYTRDDISVITKGLSDINWVNISKIKQDTIYKVLQELMINMSKHSEASLAAVTFDKKKRKINIIYTDNGIGTDLKKNTGLQNVENRIQTINGTITFDSKINKGFKAIITV